MPLQGPFKVGSLVFVMPSAATVDDLDPQLSYVVTRLGDRCVFVRAGVRHVCLSDDWVRLAPEVPAEVITNARARFADERRARRDDVTRLTAEEQDYRFRARRDENLRSVFTSDDVNPRDGFLTVASVIPHEKLASFREKWIAATSGPAPLPIDDRLDSLAYAMEAFRPAPPMPGVFDFGLEVQRMQANVMRALMIPEEMLGTGRSPTTAKARARAALVKARQQDS